MESPTQKGDLEIHKRGAIGITGAARIHQKRTPSAVPLDGCAILLVRHGRARLQNSQMDLSLSQGDAVAIAEDRSFNMMSIPGEGTSTTEWVVVAPRFLPGIALDHAGVPTVSVAARIPRVDRGFIRAFDDVASAIRHPGRCPTFIAAHRVTGLLLWLVHYGHRFSHSAPGLISRQVRELLRSSPAEPWSLKGVAAHLDMSEATLRRRLSGEGASFSNLLIDTRMSMALMLLQTTDSPVGHIALTVGYDSASRFTARFRRQFGCSPLALRHEHFSPD